MVSSSLESNLPEPASSASRTPLLDILSQKVIPWVEQEGMQRVIVAEPSSNLSSSIGLPEGVRVSRLKLYGSYTPVKRRLSGYATVTTTRWPQDGLEAKRVPMVVCVVDGQADLRVGAQILHCPEGVFVLLPPGAPHPDGMDPHLEGLQRETGSCTVLWLCPQGGGMGCWICHSRGRKHWASPIERVFVLNRQALLYLEAMTQEATARRIGYEKICQSLLVALFVSIRREIEEESFAEDEYKIMQMRTLSSSHVHFWDPITYAQDYIRSRLAEPWTIDRIAHTVCMSRTQFTKHFRRETGKSFSQFLTECRLEEAKSLLRDMEWPIAVISKSVGLETRHLRGLFDRYVGMSPSEFRGKSRQKP